MKKTTFKIKDNIKFINKNFYFIPFNGESLKNINFLGRKFKNIKSRSLGVHQIAIELAKIDNKVTYPTIVILNSKYQIDFQKNRYLL